ncbi:hypothetical protein EYZ11_001493 [Aspergillus tanneri]|uniref:Aminoglycoside phosphotransferase domain-containing protein n=1 Tax=Aspergillus tanneri TaxID=1220188 RepID=A0A4S3JUF6_9EURO|nr:hypothetical protein EYZ11_001493 [Aspergillus tanneri]
MATVAPLTLSSQDCLNNRNMSPSVFDYPVFEYADTAMLHTVVGQLYPREVYVTGIHPLEGHLHSMYLLIISNGEKLLLKTPRLMTPILRQEESLLQTEAQAMTILEQSAISHIPSLLHYDTQGHSLGPTFLLRRFIVGTTLQEMGAQLSDCKRKEIERTLGSLANEIAQHVSPFFGSLGQVACGTGKRSWREAFLTLFEGILRDSEDVFVNLPYTEIRHQIYRLSPVLDEVTLAQLVVVDLGRPSQVLLEPATKQVSGIIDLSSALWGDVYMAEIFENPSFAVLDGFGCPRTKSQSESIRHLLYVQVNAT